MRLIARMIALANSSGKTLNVATEGWTARPVSVQSRQSNVYDCGVWVLAGIAATLRGFHVTGLEECDMLQFRSFMLRLACTLTPVK
jgi:hypothetical protein